MTSLPPWVISLTALIVVWSIVLDARRSNNQWGRRKQRTHSETCQKCASPLNKSCWAAKISSCLDTVSSFHGTACKCPILEMGLIVAICSPIVILDTPHSKNITETAINADTSIAREVERCQGQSSWQAMTKMTFDTSREFGRDDMIKWLKR